MLVGRSADPVIPEVVGCDESAPRSNALRAGLSHLLNQNTG